MTTATANKLIKKHRHIVPERNFYDELSYWEYTLDRYPAELDYYAVNTDGSHESKFDNPLYSIYSIDGQFLKAEV